MRNRYNHVFAVFVFMAAFAVGVKPATSTPVPIGQPIASVKLFLNSLSKVLRKDLVRPFEHHERFNFGWVPGACDGVSLKDINVKQRKLMLDALRSVLSPEGFQKVQNILHAEAALAKLEEAPDYRSPQKYWFAVFGKPKQQQLWGLRFKGHHISLNLTLKANKIVAAMPTFIGSNPSKIPSGPQTATHRRDNCPTVFSSVPVFPVRKARRTKPMSLRGKVIFYAMYKSSPR